MQRAALRRLAGTRGSLSSALSSANGVSSSFTPFISGRTTVGVRYCTTEAKGTDATSTPERSVKDEVAHILRTVESNMKIPPTTMEELHDFITSAHKNLERAISIDPSCARAYYLLAQISPQGNILNGQTLTQTEVMGMAVQVARETKLPGIEEYYFSLGTTMAGLPLDKATITLADGTTLSRRQCLLLAAEGETPDHTFLSALAFDMTMEEEVEFMSEKSSKRDILRRSLKANPAYALTYLTLADTMQFEELIELDGSEVSKIDLWKLAVHHEPNSVFAYLYLLETMFQKGEHKIMLHGGVEETREGMCKKAVATNPRKGHAFAFLAECLPERTSTVCLLDGQTVTRDQLYIQAVNRSRDDVDVLCSFALSLGEEGSVQAGPNAESVITGADLLQRAATIDPARLALVKPDIEARRAK